MDHDHDDDYFSNPSDASSNSTDDDDTQTHDSDDDAEDMVNIEQLKSELEIDGDQEGGAPQYLERVVEPLDENMQRFSNELRHNHILMAHPECVAHSDDELRALAHVVRDDNGNIVDDFHRTIPILTKYERARIIGARAEQINAKAIPLVSVPDHIIDGVVIATMELEAKKSPFIIKRPLPDGSFEFWRVNDLEQI